MTDKIQFRVIRPIASLKKDDILTESDDGKRYQVRHISIMWQTLVMGLYPAGYVEMVEEQ